MGAARAIANTPTAANTAPTPAAARRAAGSRRRTSAATAMCAKNRIAIHSWRNMPDGLIISLYMRRRSTKRLTHETECVSELRWQLRASASLLRTAPRRANHHDDAPRRAARPAGTVARLGAVHSVRHDRPRRDAGDGVGRAARPLSAHAERVHVAHRRLGGRGRAHLEASVGWRADLHATGG